MDNQEKPKWYFKTWSLVGSFLCVGPFMLPLVWTHPRFSIKTKIVVTIIVLAVTYFSAVYLLKSAKNIVDYYQLPSNL
jgi:hypothetical protein